MDLPLLFLFGAVFSVIVVCVSKPMLIIPKTGNWELSGKLYQINANTRYVPIVLFISVFFVCFAAFQDIYAGIYDQGNYKSFFDDAANYSSLKAYLETHEQEYLYMTVNWVLRQVTDSYNVVLILFFSFMYYALARFFYTTHQEPSFILFLAVFCLVFAFVVQSYCIMRTGISVSAGLLVFSELQQLATTKLENICKILKVLIWTFISIGCHTLGLFILPIVVMYFIYKRTSFRTFLFWFVLFFILGYAGQLILVNFLSFYKRFLLYVGLEANPAYKTYFTNLCLLFAIIYRRKRFFSSKNIALHFVIFMCSFYIYDFELLMTSIMFRMIYFSRPSTAIVISNLWKIYMPKKNEIIIPLLVRLFLVIYVTFNFYGFVIAMPRYGLDYYKFGGFYNLF